MLLQDENLSDLPPQNLTSEYVDNLIKIEIGRAFTIYIVKFTGERIRMLFEPFFGQLFRNSEHNTSFLYVLAVIVSPESTVADIKRSFQVIINAQEEKDIAPRKISWYSPYNIIYISGDPKHNFE